MLKLFTSSRQAVTPTLSIRKAYPFIGFNKAAVAVCELKKYSYGRFFWDAQAKTIVIEFTLDKIEGSYKLIKNERAGCMINATAFLDYIDKKRLFRGRVFTVRWDQRKHLMTACVR